MKICVIGAGGFVGAHMSQLLAADPDYDDIALLDVADFQPPDDRRVQKTVGDLSDRETREDFLKNADQVVFLAAILGGAAEANYDLARKVNVDATLDVMEFLKAQNPQTRLVLASTIAVYAKPMPDPVTDATPTGPSMVYGAQKLMMEVALSNFAKKGWLDGVSVRPSGVMARDGADAGLKSAFMSRLFWCVKRGEDITLPVAPDNRTWLTSVDNVARNFIHAAKLPTLGDTRAFTLPALSVTFGDLVDALKRAFPKSPSKITFDPDPDLVSLFGHYPKLITLTADELGFSRDETVDALVQNALK